MKTFKDAWKFPLELDDLGLYIRDRDYNTVAMFVSSKMGMVAKNMIMGCINGHREFTTLSIFYHYQDGYIIDSQDNKIILIRGWGYLTGSGGLSLPVEEAAKIQDEFAEYIVQRLNFRQ